MSFSAGSHFNVTDTNGRILRVFRFGRAEGTPLFYFHGWPGSGIQAALAQRSAEKLGYAIASPDRPGIGGSTFVPGRKIVDWPERVERIADHLGWDQFHILAVSGGCPYALITGIELRNRVKSVTLCCGAAFPELILDEEFSFPVYRLLLQLYRKCPKLLNFGLHLTKVYFKLGPSSVIFLPILPFLPAKDRNAVRPKEARTKLARSIAASFSQHPRGPLHDATRYIEDWGFDPGRNAVPVSFHHGTMDRNIPLEAARRTAARVPNSRMTEYPGEGHYSLPLTRIEEIINDIPVEG